MGKQVRLLTLVFAALLAAQGSAFAADLSAPYLPLTFGNRWAYQFNTTSTENAAVGLPAVVNTVTVMPLAYSDGQVEYYTNDANGIRLHRLDAPATSIPFCNGIVASESDVYSPPLQVVPATVTLGQSYASNGSKNSGRVEGVARQCVLISCSHAVKTLKVPPPIGRGR